jgi:cytochrome bd-type quinol oxidase subunit 2
METSTADWVFGATVSSGTVALLTGVTWLTLLGLAKPPPDPAPPTSRWNKWVKAAWLICMLILVSNSVHSGWSNRHEPYNTMIKAITLAVLAYPLAGLLLLAHRLRRTGQRPPPHRSPLAMFWLLPLLFLTAVTICGWTIHAQIDSRVPCRPHTPSTSVNAGTQPGPHPHQHHH